MGMEDAGRQLEETIVTSIKDRVYLRLCSGHVPFSSTKYLKEWWSFCDYVQSFFFLLCGDGESE